MGRLQNRFLTFVSRYSPKKKFTEATATTALSRWLFRGHGKSHLSFPPSDDGVGRLENASPRHFSCPTNRERYAWWQPFRDHLVGDCKGVVSDAETTFLPFVAVDIDRHSGAIRAEDHQRIVLDAGRYLRRFVPHVKWLAEINPKNGSTKFFGFLKNGNHFTKLEAQRLAASIREELIKEKLCHNNNVEVFPNNCHAVWLPLRRDKITVVDAGMLPRCTKKIRDVTYFPQRVMEDIRCYSALNLMGWIYCGDNYDEATLVSALRFSCAGLPDEVTVEAPSSAGPKGKAPSPAAREPVHPGTAKPTKVSTIFDFEEPDAFKKNWTALLSYSRDFFKTNKRLPTTNESLNHLKANNLFSGCWTDNEANRRHRVAAILQKIEETFDPSLLSSDRRVELNHEIFLWCRRQLPHGPSGIIVGTFPVLRSGRRWRAGSC